MEFSSAGLDLLKKSEGFRDRVYLDATGFPTIGYGHRLLNPASFSDGIEEAQAAELLVCDVRDAVQCVERMVKVPLTQGQFDALVDFTFNLGGARLASSTLLRLLNAGNYAGAGEQILLWDKAGGKVESGLAIRRRSEYQLWTGTQPDAGLT